MAEHLQSPDRGVEVVLVDYDQRWPVVFEQLRGRIVRSLGARALEVHHAGSTSVPGLAAKATVDIVLVVDDPSDEPAYAPPLIEAGFTLHGREPEWFEHRIFTCTSPRTNLHVFGPSCPEVARMLAFRDRLRSHDADRALYERAKRELSTRRWDRMQDYADAKSEVVAEILARQVDATALDVDVSSPTTFRNPPSTEGG